MSQSMWLTLGVAEVILRVIGMTHEQVVEMGWPGSYEFYCPSFFDVKLSYDPNHEGGMYYIKSYPSDPKGNMRHFLKFFNLYSKYQREAEGYEISTWYVKDNLESSIYMYCTMNKKFGRWTD